MYCSSSHTKLTPQKNFKSEKTNLDRGIGKKTASPASTVKVVFIGQAGIDTGALRKEFLTGMLVI